MVQKKTKKRKDTGMTVQSQDAPVETPRKPGKTGEKDSSSPDPMPEGPSSPVAPAPLKERGPAPSQGYFSASDGSQLWFEDTGGPGIPLFFVYGLGCSIQHWKYPRQHFGLQGLVPRRQVYMDLRGHGLSAQPEVGRPFSVKQTVEDLAELCRLREIDQAVFLGQSMGGSLIIALAREYPRLVQKAVLLGSPSRSPKHSFPVGSIKRSLWEKILQKNQTSPQLIASIHRSVMKVAQKKPFYVIAREMIRYAGFNPSLARTDDIEEYIAKISMVDGNTFFQMAAELENFDVKDYEGSLTLPLLLIAGARDLVIPLSEQLRYKSYLPHTQVEIVPHGSHCPHFDDPKLVNRILENFLSMES